MRFAPYLQSIDMSFVNKHYTYAEMTLGWSEPGLESVIGSYVEVGYPSGSLPLPLNPVKPFMRFIGLPSATACLGSFNVSFTNGAVLENTSVDIFCLPCLSRLSIRYQPYWNNDYSCQAVAAVLSWEIEPSLMNRVAKYTVNSEIGTQEVSIYDNSLVLSGIAPGENIPVTFSAYAYDGTVLGQIAFSLYTPVLQLIPTQSQESNLGYQKTMDPSGVTETYNVNHNKTLGQLTTPTQAHAQETRSLGTNLPSMNPSTVVSGDANEYVQSFDPNNYNQPFDYSDALTGAAQIAPNATATLTQTHQGNYTLVHGGTLNQTTTVNQNTQTITAPQINNTIETYNGTFNGDTFNETAINKYIQIDNEQAQINEQSIAAPTYTENTNTLQQIITGTCNVNASSINMSGNTWTHNGTIYQSGGPANLGGGGGGSTPSFVLPRKVPTGSQIYNQDMHLSPTGYRTLATMESVKLYYYNDQDSSGKTDPPSGNCTYGTGHLVKPGPCGSLLGTPVSDDQVKAMLQQDVAKAENAVKKYITKVKLTQAKFDALVCFTFNEGVQPLLRNINDGLPDSEVVKKMLTYNHAKIPHSNESVFEGGLLKRCEWEAVAFGYTGPYYENRNPPTPTWGANQ